MIADIMSDSISVLPGDAPTADLAAVLATEALPAYLVISLSETTFSVVDAEAARVLLQRLGDKLGPALLELPLRCLPELREPGDLVSIDDSEQVARAAALRSPAKRVLVVRAGVPVGVVREHVRGALFGALPASLYGDRWDLFEKGRVSPRHPLTCPHCAASFDFYRPAIVGGAVICRCPACEGIVE